MYEQNKSKECCPRVKKKEKKRWRGVLKRVADPDPHYFGKLDPDPHYIERLDPDRH
jgi:hypothetical protein